MIQKQSANHWTKSTTELSEGLKRKIRKQALADAADYAANLNPFEALTEAAAIYDQCNNCPRYNTRATRNHTHPEEPYK